MGRLKGGDDVQMVRCPVLIACEQTEPIPVASVHAGGDIEDNPQDKTERTE
jgi:hypothetical protein